MSTAPAVASAKRGIRLMSVDFPLPVLPTIAVTSPGPAEKEIADKTGSSAPG